MTAIAKTGKATAQKYAELLTTALPKSIETEAENERALEVVNRLMRGSERNFNFCYGSSVKLNIPSATKPIEDRLTQSLRAQTTAGASRQLMPTRRR